jgi:hypothetical protein
MPVYNAMVKGMSWHSTAWIAGCRNANNTYKAHKAEDSFLSNKMMPHHGTFDKDANAIPADALNNAKEITLTSITAWQRPLLAGDFGLAFGRAVLNDWAAPWTGPWNSMNQDMKYATRDVMEHWFLVCKFMYNDEPLFVRIERTQTGILVTRCEYADVQKGKSFDSDACVAEEECHAGAQKISDTQKNPCANNIPAADGVTLEDVLKFCVDQEDKKYKMFFNNCRQFAKFAFDKFTTQELQIPSLDKGWYTTNAYGPSGGNSTY